MYSVVVVMGRVQRPRVLVGDGEVERGLVPDLTASKKDVNRTGWHCSVHEG